jgi:hypothetical protein
MNDNNNKQHFYGGMFIGLLIGTIAATLAANQMNLAGVLLVYSSLIFISIFYHK